MKMFRTVLAMCLLFLGFLALRSPASDRAWTGGGDGTDWFNTNNWTPNDSYPLVGENVTISSGASVVLSNSTALLGDFVITNATLTFTNWSTTLNATNVTIWANGIFTLPPCFTNNQVSNRVHVVCTNFTLLSGGRIDANGRGFGQTTTYGTGPGLGGGGDIGNGYGGGAGYGGRGGAGSGGNGGMGNPYGAATNTPTAPGSGGGSYSGGTWGKGGAGGGAIWIEASGTATVSGALTANGTNGTSIAGSGSGGGVYVACWTFAGSNGTVSANGTNALDINNAGGSGGGRIVILYTNVAANTRVSFSTSPGTGWGNAQTSTRDSGGSCRGQLAGGNDAAEATRLRALHEHHPADAGGASPADPLCPCDATRIQVNRSWHCMSERGTSS